MSESLADCLFCNRTEFVVAATDDVFVQLDDAPIVEGHTLICPRLHYPSLADVPASVAASVSMAVRAVTETYEQLYGPTVLFEHGRTGHCVRRNPGERICHHAHLHIVPLDGELTSHIKIGQHVPFQDFADLPALAGDVEGYLLAGSSRQGHHFYPVIQPLGSHYLRTVAARAAGDEALADWEELMNTERSVRLRVAAGRRIGSTISEALVSPAGSR